MFVNIKTDTSDRTTPTMSSGSGRMQEVSSTIFADLAKAIPSALGKMTKSTRAKKEQEKVRSHRKNKLFRRIEADIRERDRKRIPGMYVRRNSCNNFMIDCK